MLLLPGYLNVTENFLSEIHSSSGNFHSKAFLQDLSGYRTSKCRVKWNVLRVNRNHDYPVNFGDAIFLCAILRTTLLFQRSRRHVRRMITCRKCIIYLNMIFDHFLIENPIMFDLKCSTKSQKLLIT